MDETFGDQVMATENGEVSASSGPGRRAMARGLATLLLIALATTFAVQNSESVDVEFLSWSFSASKIVIMIASAVVGILVWKLVARLARSNDA